MIGSPMLNNHIPGVGATFVSLACFKILYLNVLNRKSVFIFSFIFPKISEVSSRKQRQLSYS
jgi:hypothetical protein